MRPLLASLLLFPLASLPAQTNWNNPGTGSWFNAGNWSAGIPTAADDAFVDNGGISLINTGGAAEALSLTIDNGSRVILSSGSLTTPAISGAGTFEVAGGILSDGGAITEIMTPALISGSFAIDSSGSGVYFSDRTEIAAGTHLVQVSDDFGQTCFEAELTGSGNLTFQAAPGSSGFLVSLCGSISNTFTGTLTIGTGVLLELSKDPGAVAISGGLDLQAGSEAMTFTGGQFGENSRVNVDGILGLSDLLDFNAEETIGELTGSGLITTGFTDATLRIKSGVFTGDIEDSCGCGGIMTVVKIGPDTLTLSGNNTFTGGLFIQQGILEAASNTALGSGNVIVESTGTLLIAEGVQNSSVVQMRDSGQLQVYGQQNGNIVTLGGSPSVGVFDDGVITGSIDLGTSPDATLILSPSGNRSLTGMVRGSILSFAGNITKQGTGVLRINSPFTAPGGFDVTDGTLSIESRLTAQSMNTTGTSRIEVDGTLTLAQTLAATGSSAIQVNGRLTAESIVLSQSATLSGSGTIIGNLANSGILNPGNSPGLLTIRGNYAQRSSGAFTLEIASLSEFDRLRVLGRANLAGRLNISLLGGFTPEAGDTFEFITATRGVNGRFDQAVINAPIPFALDYNSRTVVLEILSNRRPYTDFAITDNQFAIAEALETYRDGMPSPDFIRVAGILDFLPAGRLRSAFDAIAPLEIFALSRTALSISNTQLSQLENHLLGFQNAFSSDTPVTAGPEPAKNPLIVEQTPAWSAFIEGSGIFARIPTLNDIQAFNYQTGAVTVGGDYPLTATFRIGIYAGYAGTNVDLASGSDLSLDSGRFGLYAAWNPLRNLNLYGAVGGGYNSFDYDRRIVFAGIDRTAHSSPSGSAFNSLIGASYDIQRGNLTFGPFASLQYNLVSIDEFEESGAGSLNLRYEAQNDHSLRTNLGVKASYQCQASPSITLVPQVRLAWQHEYLDDPDSVFARLDNGGGPGFSVVTPGTAEDSFLASAGIMAQFSEHCSASLYYTANVAFDTDYVHAVQAAFRYTW